MGKFAKKYYNGYNAEKSRNIIDEEEKEVSMGPETGANLPRTFSTICYFCKKVIIEIKDLNMIMIFFYLYCSKKMLKRIVYNSLKKIPKRVTKKKLKIVLR